MSEKSRVVLYEELRKRISDMEVYSFENGKKKQTDEKKANGHLSLGNRKSEIIDSTDSDSIKGIQKNTLSMSIDELIEEQDSLQDQANKKMVNKEFHKKKEKKRFSVINLMIWILCAIAALVFVILIIVLLFR